MIGKLVEETNQGLATNNIEVLFEPELHNDPLIHTFYVSWAIDPAVLAR